MLVILALSMSVTVMLFCCGISKVIVGLSELDLIILVLFLSVFLGLCLSSTAHKWIESHFPQVAEAFGGASKEVKAFLFSFLICSVVIKASNQSYETSKLWNKSYDEGQVGTKLLSQADALRLDETNSCPTFDNNEAHAITDGEWLSFIVSARNKIKNK